MLRCRSLHSSDDCNCGNNNRDSGGKDEHDYEQFHWGHPHSTGSGGQYGIVGAGRLIAATRMTNRARKSMNHLMVGEFTLVP